MPNKCKKKKDPNDALAHIDLSLGTSTGRRYSVCELRSFERSTPHASGAVANFLTLTSQQTDFQPMSILENRNPICYRLEVSPRELKTVY
jgi:hypothetical protein